EFVRVHTAALARRSGLGRVVLVIVGVMFGLLLAVRFAWGGEVPLLVWIGFGVVAAVVLLNTRRAAGRGCEKWWDESPADREPRVYEFDEDGIAHAPESGGGEWTELSWSQVREVTRVGRTIVLWVVTDPTEGAPQIHYLPESALTDEQ